jgi:hypothetical protein
MEATIIFLFEPSQWRYWRESKITIDTSKPFAAHALAGPHTATMAYSLDAEGNTVRVWWLFPEASFLDGIDPPRESETIPFEFVHPQRIKLNSPSGPWLPAKDPQRLHARLEKRPERLLRRWAEWEYKHVPRVELPPPPPEPPKTKWQRFKGLFHF